MSNDIKLSALRLPVDLHAKIVAAAEANGRSRHAEMLHRMEASFGEPVAELDPDAREKIEARIENVFTTCFTGLEDRIAEMLGKQFAAAEMSLITEVRIDDSPMVPRIYRSLGQQYAGAHKPDAEAGEQLREAARKAYPLYFTPGLMVDSDPLALLRRFESLGWKGTRSPTGRLSESQPELQDLPPISGMNTLAAALRRKGCVCSGGLPGETAYHYLGDEADLRSTRLNFGGFYNGGFCGKPEGELPKILERGEPVIDWSKYKQMAGRGFRWVENIGKRPAELAPEVEIEMMTRPHRHLVTQRVGDIPSADWVRVGDKLPRIACWRPTAVTVNVVNTALADAEKMAGPYGFNGNYEGWTVNPGDYPAEHGTKVDVLFQDGGRLYNQDVMSIGWVSNKIPSLNVTHWRLAE